MKRKQELIVGVIVVIITIVILGYMLVKNINEQKKEENNVTSIDTNIEIDNSDEEINWDKYDTKDLTLTDTITITNGGIYNLTRTITDGMITIDTNDYVKLVLNNVSITNSNGPAIYIKNAKTVLIYLSDNSSNYLEDSSNYLNYDEDINATIYSKDDLVFDGNGSLTVKANYEDGIVSKDDLKIKNGTFYITSTGDGIRGKDSVHIINGNFDITSSKDGIKSTNTNDTNKGYVYIENGVFKINATLDGIQAETKLIIKSGEFDIKTGNGSTNNSKKDTWGNWSNTKSTDTKSAKGIKAGNNIIIENATFNLDTSDDAIHSNNYIKISNGTYNISSGDDGIHADNEIIIEDGNIDIKESYEGIEAAKITIYNGNIKVVASDDGINVAGGSDQSSMNRPGASNYKENTNNILTIYDGNIYVNSSGDGIDINGSGYLYGGVITVDGPTSNGDGALDYDGEFIVNGGTLIAVGSSGMAQGVSSNSTQYNVMINLENTYQENKKIIVLNENNEEIISYTPSKSFSSIVISSNKLLNSSTYTLKIDDEVYKTFTISSITTNIGTSRGMNSPDNHSNPKKEDPPSRR